ncbi:hypothetical protein [Arsenophonus nasoniae]|uniref:Uncharacterized protein n=1 Tax=Arsenophonus nasoniae TaxID=638 RepID=A0AA95GAF6_9GAMM|nr:hypothetical protein [Arsenophonus nasoniae]WGL94639.1 hypothetical protein QE207_13105 [Arsenophonus nasoniae]WGL95331.1 hypothetical protein QE207_17075 [Arsenophonus nasoniae]
MLKQISTHSFGYRNFTIIKLPRKVVNPITRYHVWLDDHSFGKFDALAEATKYIDKLYGSQPTSLKQQHTTTSYLRLGRKNQPIN